MYKRWRVTSPAWINQKKTAKPLIKRNWQKKNQQQVITQHNLWFYRTVSILSSLRLTVFYWLQFIIYQYTWISNTKPKTRMKQTRGRSTNGKQHIYIWKEYFLNDEYVSFSRICQRKSLAIGTFITHRHTQ